MTQRMDGPKKEAVVNHKMEITAMNRIEPLECLAE